MIVLPSFKGILKPNALAFVDYPFAQMSDDFNDNSRDASKWVLGGRVGVNPAIPVLEQNGRVEISPPSNLSGLNTNGYVSRLAYNLTDAFLIFNHTQYTALQATADVRMGAFQAANLNSYLEISYASGGAARTSNNGSLQDTAFTASGSNKYLAISHTSYNDKINYFQSVDGINWVLLAQHNRGTVDITAMRLFFTAGTSSADFNGVAYFDAVTANYRSSVAGTFDDNFNDNSRDALKWTVGSYASNDALITVSETGSQLQLQPRSNIATFGVNGYLSANSYNFTGKFAQVELASAGNNTQEYTNFVLMLDASNYVSFIVFGGTFSARSRVAGVNTDTAITYDVNLHRHFRLRHQTSDDKIYWETSVDGVMWTQQKSLARPFAITSMKANLVGGSNASIASPAVIIFDNFVSNLA